jgi:hypothetical protein
MKAITQSNLSYLVCVVVRFDRTLLVRFLLSSQFWLFFRDMRARLVGENLGSDVPVASCLLYSSDFSVPFLGFIQRRQFRSLGFFSLASPGDLTR